MIVPFCNPTSKAISQARAIMSCFLIKSSQPLFLSLSYFLKVVRDPSAPHPSPVSGLPHPFPSSHSTCLTPNLIPAAWCSQTHRPVPHQGDQPSLCAGDWGMSWENQPISTSTPWVSVVPSRSSWQLWQLPWSCPSFVSSAELRPSCTQDLKQKLHFSLHYGDQGCRLNAVSLQNS